MPLTKEQKKKIIEDLKEKIAKQKAIVFVDIRGLKAKELFDLRERLKKTDCLLQVYKKTLLNITSKEKKLNFDAKKLKGQIALVFGFKDELSPAKIVYQFAIANEKLKILGGFFENKFKEIDEIITLAMIPSREELLARFVGSISAPISNFVYVLQGNIKGLITVLAKAKT